MPYRDPKDRQAAKRRYQASPKGRETAHRYYLSTRPEKQQPINPAPLAQTLTTWRN
jgi:hypothetical protein